MYMHTVHNLYVHVRIQPAMRAFEHWKSPGTTLGHRCCDVGHKTGRKLDHVVETILFIRCWPHHILYSDIPSGYLT